MEKLKIEQGTKEWLEIRKNHVGASDAPIIMGTAKWKLPDGRIKTPYLLWQEKLGLADLSCNNAATRYGKSMEEPARLVYQEMIRDLVDPVCVKNKKYPHLLASLDGLNITEDRSVEIKNCNEEDHTLSKRGRVPDKYYPQVQMQIMVTELPYVDYFSFHKGEGVIVKVKRDDEYISRMEKKLEDFWDCVESLIEPPLTEDDYIEQGIEWLKIAERIYEIKQQKKILCEEEKALEEELKSLSSNRSACSKGFRYVRSTLPGLIDYKSIPELLNRDLGEFRGDPIIKWSLKRTI